MYEDRFVGISTALTLRGPRNRTIFMYLNINEPSRYPHYHLYRFCRRRHRVLCFSLLSPHPPHPAPNPPIELPISYVIILKYYYFSFRTRLPTYYRRWPSIIGRFSCFPCVGSRVV